MSARRLYAIEEVVGRCGTRREQVITYVREHWISPVSGEGVYFDDEDVARARLIRELQDELGVNDEAVPIILRLLDQLHCLRSRLATPEDPVEGPDGSAI